MMREFTLEYPSKLFDLWKNGKLHEAWFWEHEGLFDQHDFELANGVGNDKIAQHKLGYHFGEWFTMIVLRKRGFEVFNSTCFYDDKRNEPRFQRAKALLGRKAFDNFYNSEVYPPDLLVFDPILKLVFFVEVKRGRETLKPNQQTFFPEIEKKFGFPVLIARLQPK